MQDTLDPVIQATQVESGIDEPAVRTFLKLVRDNYSAKAAQDAKNRLLRDFVESGFDVVSPDGTRKINCKKLYQALIKTLQRVQVPDIVLHASGRPESIEKIVTDALSTILRKGDFMSMFTDKGGLFQNGFAYGYAFGHFGAREGKGNPFKFEALTSDNVYVDAKATGMRSGSKRVKRVLIVSQMSYADFVSQYPEFKGKTSGGRIPRDISTNSLDQDEIQGREEENMIEVAYGYDLLTKTFVQFCGRECVIMEKLSGKDYIYTFKNKQTGDEEAYLPVIHFKCLNSLKGFYDHGIFDTIYDLAVVYSRILDMQANYTIEGVDPVRWLSVPKGQASKIFAKMDLARRMKANNQTPVVALEYDPNRPNANQIDMKSLQVQSLINEAQILFDRIDLEIKRFGIVLDEFEGEDPTEMQIQAYQNNANKFVKHVINNNKAEFEFIFDVILDLFPKLVSKKDKTLVQMTTAVQVENEGQMVEIKADGVTFGMIAEELEKHEYFVKVNLENSVDNSLMKMTQVKNLLAVTPQGTKAYYALLSQFAQMNDQDQNSEAFQSVAQAQQPQMQAAQAQPQLA